MDKQFIVDRQGKDFVLYAGLLDQAHREGLKRISTKLLQAPAADNGHIAICWAEVETEKGVFCGIGDAGPANVSRAIAPHSIRMAETRAKARALRDAINVAMVTVEELGDDEPDTAPAPSQRPAPKPAPEQVAPKPATKPTGGPTTAQQKRWIETWGKIGLIWFGLTLPPMPTTAAAAEDLMRQMREALGSLPVPDGDQALTDAQRGDLQQAGRNLAAAGGNPAPYPDTINRATAYKLAMQFRTQLAERQAARAAAAAQ